MITNSNMGDMGDGRFLWQPMQALVNFVQTPPHASATYTYPISFNSPSSPLCLFSSSHPQSPLYQALMSHHQGPVTAYPPPSHVYPPPTPYPPPGQVYPPPPPSWEGQHQVIYVAAPPPVGYPMRDGEGHPQNHRPVETKSRGDGFWKGCAAALCCCCVLDCCF